MADLGSFQTIVSTLQNIVTGLGNLTQAITNSTSAIFPQTQGTSATATTGPSITLPTHPVGYIDVTLPNGTLGKVPYYAP